MIRPEPLARGRLFTRFLISLAAVLAVLALVADALAAPSIELLPVAGLGERGGLYLPVEPFQRPMPEPIEGWEAAMQVDDLFTVDAMGWPFTELAVGSGGAAATTEADLALGALCFLAAGLLLWVARRRPGLDW